MHFQHILLTTDLSEASFEAFEIAAYQAKMENSEITLLHVLDNWEIPSVLYAHGITPSIIESYKTDLLNEAKSRLESIAKERFHGQAVNPQVILGNKGSALDICNYAKDNSSDLIIIASHGRGSVAQLLLGSTVEKIIRTAPCPVLVVPKQKK